MDELRNMLYTKSALDQYPTGDIERAIVTLETPVETLMVREYLSMVDAKKKHLRLDAVDGKYKRKTEEDYEHIRNVCLKRLEDIRDSMEKIQHLTKTANEISEGIHYLAYNEAYKECCWTAFRIEVCHNMLQADCFSLTDISKATGTEIGDIYHLAEKFNLQTNPTEEELKQIEEYDKRQENNNCSCTKI